MSGEGFLFVIRRPRVSFVSSLFLRFSTQIHYFFFLFPRVLYLFVPVVRHLILIMFFIRFLYQQVMLNISVKYLWITLKEMFISAFCESVRIE